MSTIVHITDNSFDPEVLKCDIPVLASFWADWSVSCQELAPTLSQLAANYPEQLKVVKVEIEANPNTTAAYDVLTVPTLVLFKNGQEVQRLQGVQTSEALLVAISPYFDE